MAALDSGRADGPRPDPAEPLKFALTLSPQAADLVDSLSREMGAPRDVVMTRALVLLRLAAEAARSGKYFGVATSPDALENEVVGLMPAPQ